MAFVTDVQRLDTLHWLRCPDCHGPLCAVADAASCAHCDRSWPRRSGIVDFVGQGRRDAEETLRPYAAALPELVRLAADVNWLHALETVIQPLPQVGPGMFAYVTDESKGDLVDLMDIRPGHKVLDLGCGLGAVSLAVAQRGADCHVADVSFEQTAFTAIRCRQCGFPAVKAVCAGDNMRLPLADRYFDAIIMNGVLEWLGSTSVDRTRKDQAQLAMLKEAYRVLRPGGQLYVSTKNLYALLHFLGEAPDHGTRLPWIGILSPHVQRVLTLGRIADSGARLHGLRGYRGLFRSTGFAEKGAYALMPEFRKPRCFIPLAQLAALGVRVPAHHGIFNRRLEGIVYRLVPRNTLKRFVYAYGFVLEKP